MTAQNGLKHQASLFFSISQPKHSKIAIAQAAGAVEYTDCTFAEG